MANSDTLKAGNKKKKPASALSISEAKKWVARGKNRNYNDLIRKRDPVTGEVYYVEKWVDPVRT